MSVEAQVDLRKAGVQEQPGLARTLAAAFADDPGLGWLLPDGVGFEHVRQLRLTGGPPLWLMLRAPQPSDDHAVAG